MKRLLIANAVLMLSVSSMSFATSVSSMDKSAVMDALGDKTITTISAATLNGKVIPDSFIGYFNKDGKMHGKFAKKPPEGAPQNDKGTWMVKADGQVCVTWEKWFHGKEQCVYFYKLSNALLITNTDNGFESLVLDADIKSGNHTKNPAS